MSVKEALEPIIKYALAKYVDKGEDAWTQQPAAEATLGDENEAIKIGFFGVFDGHGGKAAATFASRHVLPLLQNALKDPSAPEDGEASGSQASGSASSDGGHSPMGDTPATANAAELKDVAGLRADVAAAGVTEVALAANECADMLVEALPAALVQAFAATEREFFTHSQTSGTTATVAVVAGWEVLIANVGDSLGYLDTGSEVVQVSGNHRLDDSKAERERILATGAEVAQSEVEGKGVGPMRVWPGGLAMGRTIGDHAGGAVVLCEPEIRQMTLPTGGGRLVLASDGLWDLVKPHTAAHHVRGLPASKAASELVALAARNRKPRDDITVIVVDVLPPSAHDAKHPPLLARAKSGAAAALAGGPAAEPVDIFWPLTGEGATHWRRNVWQRRLAVAQEAKRQRDAVIAAEAAKAAKAAEAAERQAGGVSSNGSASDETQSDASDGEGEVQYASELHRQMAMLQMDPSELEVARDKAGPAEDEGWETVPTKPARRDSEASQRRDSEASRRSVPVDDAESADPAQREFAGGRGGRGRGRGGRGFESGGGRGRGKITGRGRGRFANGYSESDGPQQQQQESAQSSGQQQSAAEIVASIAAANDAAARAGSSEDSSGMNGHREHVQQSQQQQQQQQQPNVYINGYGSEIRGRSGGRAGRSDDTHRGGRGDGGRGGGRLSRKQLREQQKLMRQHHQEQQPFSDPNARSTPASVPQHDQQQQQFAGPRHEGGRGRGRRGGCDGPGGGRYPQQQQSGQIHRLQQDYRLDHASGKPSQPGEQQQQQHQQQQHGQQQRMGVSARPMQRDYRLDEPQLLPLQQQQQQHEQAIPAVLPPAPSGSGGAQQLFDAVRGAQHAPQALPAPLVRPPPLQRPPNAQIQFGSYELRQQAPKSAKLRFGSFEDDVQAPPALRRPPPHIVHQPSDPQANGHSAMPAGNMTSAAAAVVRASGPPSDVPNGIAADQPPSSHQQSSQDHRQAPLATNQAQHHQEQSTSYVREDRRSDSARGHRGGRGPGRGRGGARSGGRGGQGRGRGPQGGDATNLQPGKAFGTLSSHRHAQVASAEA